MSARRILRWICIIQLGMGFGAPLFAAAAEANAEILEKARSGDASAQLQLGYALYLQGDAVRGAYWFAAAARQGNPAAQYNLARCYLSGNGVSFNEHLAKEWLEKAAPQLPAAKLALARLIQKGLAADPEAVPPREAVKPAPQEALKLYLELAQLGDIDGAREAGLLLLAPAAAQEAIAQGLSLLEKAVQAHDPEAELRMADILLQGKFAPTDEKRARELLERAAKSGGTEAMVKYAFALEHGWGAPPEPEQARELYEKVLAKEYSMPAALRLANFLLAGRAGAQQDVKRAFALYAKAAESGVPEALSQLGVCYRDGLGTEVDWDRAFELFFTAARADYAPAEYHLALAFAAGQGTPQDEEAAFYWLEQAAMRGDPRALLEAGKRLLEGKGTEANPEKALLYLGAARQQGMNEAIPFLERAKRLQSTVPEAQETPRLRLHKEQ